MEELRERFINEIRLDQMIKDIGLTATKGTIADWWIKVLLSTRQEADQRVAEAVRRLKRTVHEPSCLVSMGIDNCCCASYHYNQALADLLTKIKE